MKKVCSKYVHSVNVFADMSGICKLFLKMQGKLGIIKNGQGDPCVKKAGF